MSVRGLAGCFAVFTLGCGTVEDSASRCPDCSPHTLTLTGDILLGDAAQALIDREGYRAPLVHLDGVARADTLIGNAEAPITTLTEPYNPGQRWSYNSHPDGATALAEFGFTAVSLGNNHLLDRGPAGVADTLRHFEAVGVGVFGGGMTRDAAAQPYLVQTEHGVVAVVGFGDAWINSPAATKDSAGVIPFDGESIAAGYRDAVEAGASVVFAYVHWGVNYAEINDAQRRGAALFAAAGYDLVVGHGPHVVQQLEVIEGMPVVYSLGNFVFGTPGRYTEAQPGVGVVLRASVGDGGVQRLELSCLVTDNQRVDYQPEPCLADDVLNMRARLGDAVVVDGDVAVWAPR